MKSRQGVSKAQMEVLRRMAAGALLISYESFAYKSRSGMGTYRLRDGGAETPLSWKTFWSIASVQRNPRLVEDDRKNRRVSESDRFVISPAGRALVEDSRGAK